MTIDACFWAKAVEQMKVLVFSQPLFGYIYAI
jgi:hypothetical protein